MFPVKKFENLPQHQDLINRAVNIFKKDKRVKGLYIGGSSLADEYSDIDFMIIIEEKHLESIKAEKYETAKKIGKIKAESMSGFPTVYVVFYEEEIKFDFSYQILPLEPRPDRALIHILYDPDGILEKLVKDSSKLKWEINFKDFTHKINHFFIGLGYTVPKILRGELWDAQDAVDFYRKYLIQFEDILAKRKKENYRRIELKLDSNRLELFNKILVMKLTRKELFRAMDGVLGYFEKYIKKPVKALGIYPEQDAKNMLEYYYRKKIEFLQTK